MKRIRILMSALFFLIVVNFAGLELFSQQKGFDPSDFKARRDSLSSLISDGIVIISNYSGFLERFRVDPEFYYLTGVDISDSKLVLIPKEMAAKTSHPSSWKTTLYLPPKDPTEGTWMDPQLSAGEEAVRRTGIENVSDLKNFYSDVSKLGNITDIVYLSFGSNVQGPATLPSDLQFVADIKKILPNVKINNLSPILQEMRWKKSAKEIQIMKKACEITVEGFKEAARFTKPGTYEYEVEALLAYNYRKSGAQRSAFTIIGSGPNSCILHHTKNDRLMDAGDLLVIDTGTIYEYTTTDLTRTIPVSGKFTPDQAKIYSIVLEAQKKAISIVKPGVTLAEVHKAAMDVIDDAGYGKYFITGTGHTLNGGSIYRDIAPGLRLDGMYGKYKMNRYFAADNPLVPGSIFTIEPGIYIPERNLGIRIEDDILVLENGCEVLTKQAPKEIVEIENLMKENTVHIK